VEINPTRMCELLVGLPAVDVVGVADEPGEPLRVHVQCREQDRWCRTCGGPAELKDRPKIELVDLPAFGRQSRLVWHKYRWHCPDARCPASSWIQTDDRIGFPRMALTDRAGRWACEQVGRCARSVNEIAKELGCDWHTINAAVLTYGTALIDHPNRYEAVEALGLDEVLFVRTGEYRRQDFSTQLVDVQAGQLLDVVPGRSAKAPSAWLGAQDQAWLDQVQWATLDLSATYRSVLDNMLPDAVQVADPFHVCKHANTKLDECRRRVQNQTMGHRGRKTDPLYRCRRLLTKADERLTESGASKLLGLLAAGDPDGEVATAWRAKEAVRDIYTHTNASVAMEWTERLASELKHPDQPVEVRSLGRTLTRWKHQIVAWHHAHVSNGPTEAVNNLIKRVKRAAFGFTSFRNYRIRSLLYAGKPNWDLLPNLTPH
jgi:transposase